MIWKNFEKEKPPQKTTVLWSLKRKEGWQQITGRWEQQGTKIIVMTDNDLTYTSTIALPSVRAHWMEIPEFKSAR